MPHGITTQLGHPHVAPHDGAAYQTHSDTTSTDAMDEKPLSQDVSAEESEQRKDENILQLARRMTSQSIGAPGTLFPEPSSGELDPNGPNFNAKKWAKAFYELRKESLGGSAPTTTGVAFHNLSVYGYGKDTGFQSSVGNIALKITSFFQSFFQKDRRRIDILRGVEGVVERGEMVAVLGPPGSGCSTFLKTIAGDTYGFNVAEDSTINYQGIRPSQMTTAFRGEAIYTAEVDDHFPQLTVADTLYFAAWARCPKNLPAGVSRAQYLEHQRDVIMAMFGISHTKNSRVGNDFVRGVSGGERKRVTIAEAALSYSPLQCWDNSTRGLDSANAVEFCRTLRTQSEIMGCTCFVAIYQAPQDAYDLFNKVIVLYEGRQIYFGPAKEGKSYFENLGFVCPDQQTTADFLTSMTSAAERIIRPGMENQTPRTSDEFAQAWKESQTRASLARETQKYLDAHPFDGADYEAFLHARRSHQSDSQRMKSPFTLSYVQQMAMTLWRCLVMLKGDPSLPLTMIISNFIEAIIIASIFYNLPETTASFNPRAILLFFVILMNAFSSMLEIMTLYAKRRVVEKHNRYAFYHPSAEALASMIADIPYKVANALVVNVTLYFMTNLRREPGPFFFYFLISFWTTIVMSMLFRLLGSLTKTIAQALVPATMILLIIVLYTGFALPVSYMQVWLGWTRWLNPVYYSLESTFVNEFVGRDFPCVAFVPSGGPYDSVDPSARSCTVEGAVAGQDFVNGERYINSAYGYYRENKWRNFGILIVFSLGFMVLHLIASEYVATERSEGEVLVFRRKALQNIARQNGDRTQDVESAKVEKVAHGSANADTKEKVKDVEKQTSVFHWKDVCYDIKIKSEERRILDHVDGWVKPGTLTALMGASGAGKTTLLDVLASRVTTGVVTGDMLVDGKVRDQSFQRKTGYVTQQDLHLETSTVFEALAFSALLRQPPKYSREEKIAYVDTVVELLEMEDYVDAVIGVPGVGLNVEQRKRLTIGVELAARPQLLLFLDEPTSGLDSQTSWSICDLMEKLTNNGQAILCTIHQPSSMLFQRFDRLLLLHKGRTIYFGDIGQNSHVLLDYFVRNGADPMPVTSNPAEYMLSVIGAAPGSHTGFNWADTWANSQERSQVQTELTTLQTTRAQSESVEEVGDATSYREFAASPMEQYRQVIKRGFQQYWRNPAYIYSKACLALGAALLMGLSFLNAENSERGLQNQMFGVFIFLFTFPSLVNQIMPVFITQRTMYEARERPSKAYTWKAFLMANILAELFWNLVFSVFCFLFWYYPMGLYRNAEYTDQVHSRSATMFLQVMVFFVFTSTFSHLLIAALPSEDIASAIATVMMILMFAFCGVLATPSELPGFWIFMYRVNPFTYVVEGFLGTSLANAPVTCKPAELVSFQAPGGQTCGEYLEAYMSQAGGSLVDPQSSDCQFCSLTSTNDFLSGLNMSFANRWMDFGIMWAYCIFNIAGALALYWLFRVPKVSKKQKAE